MHQIHIRIRSLIIQKTISGIRNNLLLTAILCFFAAANIIWIHIDTAPPSWDQAHYLFKSEMYYHTLIEDGVVSFFKSFPDIFKTKAPLITVMPIPFYFLFGNNDTSALYVNVLFVILAGYYLFRLGLLIAGRKEAIMSVFILNTFPLILGLSRQVYVEYGLMTFVIMWMYYLMSSQGLMKRKNALILGVVLGLGMLMKVSYPLYILFPTVYVLMREVQRTGKISKTLFANILIIFFIGSAIASIWYYKNIMTVIDFAVMSAYSDVAVHYGKGAVFSLKTIFDYWLTIINKGLSAYYVILIALVLFFSIVHSIKRNSKKLPNRGNIFLAVWFMVPFLVFTFAVNKNLRYIAPLLPAVALFLSNNLMNITWEKYRSVMVTAFLVLPAFNYVFLSFVPGNVIFEKGSVMLVSNRLGLAHPPVRETWPHRQIIEYLHRDAILVPNYNPFTTLLFDHPDLNFINLTYYAKNTQLNVQFNTNDFYKYEDLDDAVIRIEKETDYLLTKTGDIGPEFINKKNIPLLKKLAEGFLDFHQIEKIPLPDGTQLNIYRKNEQPFRVYQSSEMVKDHVSQRADPVIFGDSMQLLAHQTKYVQEGYRVKLFWKCLKEMRRNYKVFVHIYTDEDKLFVTADFQPTNNKYPTAFWRAGEIIVDEVQISGDMPEDIQIFIGVYNAQTMDRFPVTNKQADAPENIQGVKVFES